MSAKKKVNRRLEKEMSMRRDRRSSTMAGDEAGHVYSMKSRRSSTGQQTDGYIGPLNL